MASATGSSGMPVGRRRLMSLLTALVVLSVGCSPTVVTPSPSPTVVATPSPSPEVTPAPTSSPSPTPSPTAEPTPAATPVTYAPLSGLPADPAVATRLPLAVMIDDNVVARPQSGFNKASIVYQAPADGGEDRYMMIFQEQDAADIGPVRSGRPYFVKWAAEYRAGFGHYGGDLVTRTYIPTISGKLIYNLDALFGSGRAYHRISTRVRPHNAYTSTSALWKEAARHRYPSSMVEGLAMRPFGDDLPLDQRPSKGSITVPYYRGAAGYTYDPVTNSYLRSVAGKPQFDALDGSRVTARNVVVLFMALSTDRVSEPGYNRPVLAQIGRGKAIVFRDGRAIPGEWRKKNDGDLTRFFDSAGNEIPLVRGRIFVQVVPTGTKVTYDAAG